MFYSQCNDCNERWELGTGSTCICLEQEPVAWRAWVSKFPQGTGSDWVYVTKPIMKDSVHNQPLYTTPPQRTWVELTDEEIKALASWWPSYDQIPALMVLAKDIQNSLKEKNT